MKRFVGRAGGADFLEGNGGGADFVGRGGPIERVGGGGGRFGRRRGRRWDV